MFGNPERTNPQILPDGTQLGYLAPVNGVLNVWIKTIGKDDDRAVSNDTKRGIRNFQGWQADNALQVPAAQVQTPDGGTIIRVRNDAKSPWRELIEWGPDERLGGISGFSPDNQKIWITTSLDVNAARLVEYDIATSAHKVIAEDSQFDVEGVVTNPNQWAGGGVVRQAANGV